MTRIIRKTIIQDRVEIPGEPGVFVERCIDYDLRATKGWIKNGPAYSRTVGTPRRRQPPAMIEAAAVLATDLGAGAP